MSSKRNVILILSFVLCASGHAESRKWKNPDGTKEFEGEFIIRDKDNVTLKSKDGRTLSFSMEKLHATDIKWIKENHPTEEEENLANMPDEASIFDTLKFGDDRDVVTKKLKNSKLLMADLDGTFFGRVGLNGLYRIKNEIGGLSFYLFFDWDKKDKLREITLQSADQTPEDYENSIQPCWKEMIERLTKLHGTPLSVGNFPALQNITKDQILTTHVWDRGKQGSVLLGVSSVEDAYQTVVRFSR